MGKSSPNDFQWRYAYTAKSVTKSMFVCFHSKPTIQKGCAQLIIDRSLLFSLPMWGTFFGFFLFSTALNGDAWRHYWILSLTFLFYNEKSPLSVMWVRNPNQKSSASQWLNGSHHPPLAQTPFVALRSSWEAGELSWVDFTMIVSLKFSTMPSLLVQRPGLGVGLSGQWKCTSVLS